MGEDTWRQVHREPCSVTFLGTHCSRGRHQLSLVPTVCIPRPSQVCTRIEPMTSELCPFLRQERAVLDMWHHGYLGSRDSASATQSESLQCTTTSQALNHFAY